MAWNVYQHFIITSDRYKCQDKYAQKFSYKYVQFILLSILSRFLGKGAEADKIFLLL